MRKILLGNSGSGKSTLASKLAAGRAGIGMLSLDGIAWDGEVKRRPLDESQRELLDFIHAHEEWVIEGCYGDLAAAALPYCTELVFLNPGVEACVGHCRKRPWEPGKFSSAEEQNAMLEDLIDWVRSYETRGDEYGLAHHRRLFDAFLGPKTEYTDAADYGP